MKDIQGEVKISLSSLFKLLETQEEAQQLIETNKEAISILGDFLQFLKTKDYFNDIQEEFNASHDRLSIRVDSNTKRVILYLDGKKVRNQN